MPVGEPTSELREHTRVNLSACALARELMFIYLAKTHGLGKGKYE